MQNITLSALIEDSDFQVKCYGEYLRISKDSDAAAKGHSWRVMRMIHSAHADLCRQTAQAHLDKHREIETRIRNLTTSSTSVSACGEMISI